MSLDLKIVSPAKVEFRGQVERVVVPGTNGQFEILPNHAPIISSLVKGEVDYKGTAGAQKLDIEGGFVEVKKNEISLCVEI